MERDKRRQDHMKNNPNYKEKTPEEISEQERQRRKRMEEESAKWNMALEDMPEEGDEQKPVAITTWTTIMRLKSKKAAMKMTMTTKMFKIWIQINIFFGYIQSICRSNEKGKRVRSCLPHYYTP
jgi:hypothetical protein